jgi:lipopolysaccharide transport system permease protein
LAVWQEPLVYPKDIRKNGAMQSNRVSVMVYSPRPRSLWLYANPWRMLQNLLGHHSLIWQFALRDVQSRYRGSYLGVLWSLITPLVSLLVYSFVFSVIFQSKWPGVVSAGFLDFTLILFCGLIVYNVFSECAARAPSLIIGNPSYVKKVVFPLEILPVSVLGSALFNSLICLVLLLIALVYSTGRLHWTLVFLPLAFLPLILLTLGISWLLASLGVFIRDIGNFVGVCLQLLFFLTPIFYPISMVPDNLRIFLWLNPLTWIVEQCRGVILWGHMPGWSQLGVLIVGSGIVAVGGYVWFMKSKGAFADVV